MIKIDTLKLSKSDQGDFYNNVSPIIANCLYDLSIAEKYVREHNSQIKINKLRQGLSQAIDVMQEDYDNNIGKADNEVIETKGGVHQTKKELGQMISFVKNNYNRERRNDDFLLIVSFTHLVTLLDSAIIDVTREILLLVPEIVCSTNKEIKYSDLFKFNSMQALQESVIEEELLIFGYKSVKDQIEYIHKFAKIELVDKTTISNVAEIRATRNLIVHNKGIVNNIYLNSVKSSDFRISDYRTIDNEYFHRSLQTCKRFLINFGAKLIVKYAPQYKIPLQKTGFEYMYSTPKSKGEEN